jgi:hypothetical protein
MQARTIAKQVAYGRIALGAALLARPGLLSRPWVGPIAESPGGRVALVALGVRDLALGLGSLYALHRGEGERPWLLAAALADVTDAAGTAAALRSLPSPGAPGTAALAGGSAVAGVWTAYALDR